MLKDLQKMQSQMLKAQNNLKAQSFEAEAGGGMVKVAINGQG
ncbi:MAG: YbaB/EbfC family nucleoid-associated protein, partial [Fibrobacteraceae bacterium]|nr:YbaB/EbfC family nucleoid-associated protein [Fibrobacteraceae bacterium]